MYSGDVDMEVCVNESVDCDVDDDGGVCVYVYVDVYDGVYVDMNANKKHN